MFASREWEKMFRIWERFERLQVRFFVFGSSVATLWWKRFKELRRLSKVALFVNILLISEASIAMFGCRYGPVADSMELCESVADVGLSFYLVAIAVFAAVLNIAFSITRLVIKPKER